MNEIFDKLLIRVVFSVFVCLVLFGYKYAHSLLYRSNRHQLFSKFHPSKNETESIHLFSRIIGLAIVFSGLYFNLAEGIVYSFFDFFVQGLSACLIYLASIYVVESIALYNFEFSDEILKRKNMSYAVVNFAQVISLALITRIIVKASNDSLILLIFLWLFSLVLVGIASKSYKYLSNLSFNKLLIQKNMAVAYSYSGFILGMSMIIISAFDRNIKSPQIFAIQVILNIILTVIILPVIRKGLLMAFSLNDDFKDTDRNAVANQLPSVGYGIFEGALFFSSCFLTSTVTGQLKFGSFYPIFF